MRMTTHEITLVVAIVGALLIGALAKHYRHSLRDANRPAFGGAKNGANAVATPIPGPVQYVR